MTTVIDLGSKFAIKLAICSFIDNGKFMNLSDEDKYHLKTNVELIFNSEEAQKAWLLKWMPDAKVIVE